MEANSIEGAARSGSADSVLDNIRGTRDALSVRRVFGDPYEVDGLMVIPVARVVGGAGGGGGEGTGGVGETGSGFGTGFGIGARPVGVYVVRDGNVEWKPTLDVTRLARGGQMLGALFIACVTLVLLRYRRH
jgi:uncharacterized spore protein YtfJ